jgi:hypothetical protein
MRAHISVSTLAALGALLASSACKRGEESRAFVETATSAGTLALTQGDWQPALDAARASFKRDGSATARTLRSAAIVVRQEAREANDVGGLWLTRSANELDSLAVSLSSGAKRSERSLDSAFARLEHAEALNRIANATGEWAKQDRARAGKELTSGVEHFERAAENVGIDLDARATQAAADARELGRRLSDGAAATTNEFLRTVTALDTQVRRLGDRIAR